MVGVKDQIAGDKFRTITTCAVAETATHKTQESLYFNNNNNIQNNSSFCLIYHQGTNGSHVTFFSAVKLL